MEAAAPSTPASPPPLTAHRQKADFQAKLRDVPHKPGVYLMRDRLNRVIYVGKARDLRKRVGSYFMPSRRSRADLKTRALLESVYDFEFHVVRSEPEALLLEGRLIKEYRPRYNISFRDDKGFLLVKVNPQDPIPRFQLTRLRKDDGARYFGPFAHSGALRSTLNLMRDKFGLRSCRPYEPGEYDFKHCLAPVIKNCPAPCVGKISREAYRERVLAACDFLEGQSREMLEGLDKQMREAAARMDFEKAAQLRDMIDDLRRTTAPARRFTRVSLPSTVDPAADLKALGDALGLPHLPLVMECFDISNISTTHIVASMVCFKNGVPDKANYRRYRIKGVDGQNDFASMAEVIRRRYARVLLEARAAHPEDAEFSQENPQDALARLARAAANADPAPQAGDTSEGANTTGDVLIEGPGYAADETDAELASEISREREAEILALDDSRGVENVGDKKAPRAVRLPDLVIVDGGKGQLSAACKELQRLGLHELPIIGLAKEFEEIYRPARPAPLRLPEDSGALRLLQRIRDEAHRFANGYHQLLMKRRVNESILDDCPGVSERRKTALLRAFGSVERIRRASVEELAAVEGISQRLAEDVQRFLQTH
ncbi:MAG: excinuclease ABC subunit UvrC [Verrucomicrobia bacterium]|nr:excinuclease ABC subunit UvrC [Verrucomicrobiota bacterium]